MEIKSSLKNVGVATLVSGHSLYQEEVNEITDFWCVDKNSREPKVTLIISGWWWSKMGL